MLLIVIKVSLKLDPLYFLMVHFFLDFEAGNTSKNINKSEFTEFVFDSVICLITLKEEALRVLRTSSKAAPCLGF